MGIRIGNVGIDTNDMANAADFWRRVTGYQASSSDDTSTNLEEVDPAG